MKIRFADCLLDCSARQLQRAGQSVPLEPKVYELLQALIERRPGIVTSSELDELLWPKTYVARTSLTRLVSKLRAAVGDTAGDCRVIRTAHKVGYAFCADVNTLAAGRSVAPAMELIWKTQTLVLSEGEHLAGRDAACALVIEAGTVSRLHARLTVRSGATMIEDLKSTNGTHVNGTRISGPTTLDPADELWLGSEKLVIRRHSLSAPTIKLDHEHVVGHVPKRPLASG